MDRAQRLNAWLSGHALVVAAVASGWIALAAWHLSPPASLVTSDGHLVDPSTTAPLGYNVWAYGHLAYSDVFRLYAERHLFGHPVPYFSARIEYPPVTGLFMWVASLFPGVRADFVASAVGLWIAAMLTLWALRRVLPARWHWFGLTPLLVVFALLNYDLLGIAFTALALERFARRRDLAAGTLLSLGTSAKLFPAVLLPFLVARLVLDEGWRTRRIAPLVSSFVAALLLVNLPFAIGAYRNWSWFLSFNAGRSGGGPLNALSSHVALEDAVIALVVLVAAGIGVRAMRRGAGAASAASLTFITFLLVNKVYSPQYTLWVFFFALLAEWPGWTLGLLSLVGLFDYAGQFLDLYETNAIWGSSPLSHWWLVDVQPWEARLRDAGLLAAAAGAWLGRLPGADRPARVAGTDEAKDRRAPLVGTVEAS